MNVLLCTMDRTVLIEAQKQWLIITIAVIFCANGVIQFLDHSGSQFRMGIGIMMLLFSIYYAVYSVLGFSLKSKYSAKIKITEKLLELRTKFWFDGIMLTLNWKDINSIHFSKYKIDFKLTNGQRSVPFRSISEAKLKQIIREAAEQRNIEVIDFRW